MFIGILSVYSYIIWLVFFIIDYFFLPVLFYYELGLLQCFVFVSIGLMISYFITLLLNILKGNDYILSVLGAILILFIQYLSGFFILDIFSSFTFLLTNFLYSFIILSSLNQKNLV